MLCVAFGNTERATSWFDLYVQPVWGATRRSCRQLVCSRRDIFPAWHVACVLHAQLTTFCVFVTLNIKIYSTQPAADVRFRIYPCFLHAFYLAEVWLVICWEKISEHGDASSCQECRENLIPCLTNRKGASLQTYILYRSVILWLFPVKTHFINVKYRKYDDY